jgi:hypothetical protein
MNKQLGMLGWAAACTLLAFLGHFMAERVFAIPTTLQCPSSFNNQCPNCLPVAGGTGCHITTGAYKTCVTGTTGDCQNLYTYPCDGVENTKVDCSGDDELNMLCGRNYFTCDPLGK